MSMSVSFILLVPNDKHYIVFYLVPFTQPLQTATLQADE